MQAYDQYGAGGGFLSEGCEGCGCMSFCNAWYSTFGVALCEQCKRAEKLVSKANAKAIYLLTDLDLKKLGTLKKPNPQNRNWQPMQLYLQSQVEEIAEKKHGSIEQLEQLRQDRLESRLQERLRKRALQPMHTHAGPESGDAAADAATSSRNPHGTVGSAHAPLVTEAQRRVRSRLEAEHGARQLPAAVRRQGPAGSSQLQGQHGASGTGEGR